MMRSAGQEGDSHEGKAGSEGRSVLLPALSSSS